jgi:small subunit ribosomal protein S7
MRGKSHYQKKIIKPDVKYNSETVSKFINYIMIGGKKKTATNIVYKAFEITQKKLNKPALEIFEQAITNVSPLLEVRSKRVGGATYQVPMEVRPERKVALSMRWMIDSALGKQGKPMEEFLAQEIVDAYNKTGAGMTKRENMHKMAEANKAFAHFARF